VQVVFAPQSRIQLSPYDIEKCVGALVEIAQALRNELAFFEEARSFNRKRNADRHYVRVRLEDRAELLLVERDGCNDGLKLHHQVRMALGDVLPCRFVFEELGEISFRKH
jgi:hypothetical protein